MKWYMHACPACGGALHDSYDRGWVECLMCARSFRASEILRQPPEELVSARGEARQSNLLVVPTKEALKRRTAA
jgi:hypothetical protein